MTTPTAPPARKSAGWWDRFWDVPSAARGRALTVRRTAETALALLAPDLARLPPVGVLRVLDLGCGDGELSLALAADSRLAMVALDLSGIALARFRVRLRSAGFRGLAVERSPRLVRASVYELPFADQTFDAVVSFGYASAGSYDGVERELARVLRPAGVAVVDFANPSLYHWLGAPLTTLRWYRRFRDPDQAQYHFGRRGIAAHFAPAGLSVEAVGYIGAWPPLGPLVSLSVAPRADRLLSRAGGPLLGRVLLAKLRRTTS